MERNKDLVAIKDHWENPETVSLKDVNLQELERRAILRALTSAGKIDSIADVGCGDAIDTVHWLPFARKVFGFDYAEAMLEKARKTCRDRISFARLDLLKDNFFLKYDTIITKRCLINLGSFENQKAAIRKICIALKLGGRFLMLECSLNGLNNLNAMRQRQGLPSIREPHHNVYFDLAELLAFLNKLFVVEETVNFSTYYFLTRVYNQVLDAKRYEEFDVVARRFHESVDLFGSNMLGPQFLLILRKK